MYRLLHGDRLARTLHNKNRTFYYDNEILLLEEFSNENLRFNSYLFLRYFNIWYYPSGTRDIFQEVLIMYYNINTIYE